MAKTAQTKTEIQSALDRLQYLAGKRLLTKELYFKEDAQYIMQAMGITKEEKTDENGNKKTVYLYQDDGVRLLHDIYKKEYMKLAKRLTDFYKAMEHLSCEEDREVCELMYIDGYALTYIAAKMRMTVNSLYPIRDRILKVLVREGVGWAAGEDYSKYMKK